MQTSQRTLWWQNLHKLITSPIIRSNVPACLLHVGYSQLLCLMASIVSNAFPFLPYPWQVQLNGHYHPLLRAHLFQCNKQQGVYWPQLVRDTDGCPTRVLLSPSATNIHSTIAIYYDTKILLLTPFNKFYILEMYNYLCKLREEQLVTMKHKNPHR